MGGRGAWSKRGNWTPSQNNTTPSKTYNQLRPLLHGNGKAGAIKNFQRVIGNSDVEYSVVIGGDGKVMSNINRGNAHSTKVDVMYAYQHKDSSIIHNHPAEFGGTFSKADLQVHSIVGNKEMIASAKEGTYYMRATKDTNYKAFGRAYNKAEPRLEQEWRAKWDKVSKSKTFKTQKARDIAERQVFVGVYHKWFKENSSKYGLQYVYAKGRGQSRASTVRIGKSYKDYQGTSKNVYGD